MTWRGFWLLVLAGCLYGGWTAATTYLLWKRGQEFENRIKAEAIIDRVQEQLVGLMGQFACLPGDEERYAKAGFAAVGPAELEWVTVTAKEHEARGIVVKGWARPGADHSLARAGLADRRKGGAIVSTSP